MDISNLEKNQKSDSVKRHVKFYFHEKGAQRVERKNVGVALNKHDGPWNNNYYNFSPVESKFLVDPFPPLLSFRSRCPGVEYHRAKSGEALDRLKLSIGGGSSTCGEWRFNNRLEWRVVLMTSLKTVKMVKGWSERSLLKRTVRRHGCDA